MKISQSDLRFDGSKMMYHVDRVSDWLKGLSPAPIYVEIGPTSACNHRCSFCAFDYLRGQKVMSIGKDTLISALEDMAKFGVKSVMFGGEGEPLIYPHLDEIAQKAKGFGLDLAITTNGVLLTEEKMSILKNIEWIKFSIDAGNSVTYAKSHGTKVHDFEMVLANLHRACAYKREHKLSCLIGAQMVITDETVGEVEELILKVKEFGLDYFVVKPYVKHPDSINQHFLTSKDYDLLLSNLQDKYHSDSFNFVYRKQSFLEVENKSLSYDQCYGINFMALIDAAGNILPCSVFYGKEEFYYGNINQQKFSEIWKSEARQQIVEKVYKRGNRNCRNNCRLNYVNQYLDKVKNGKVTHINFI